MPSQKESPKILIADDAEILNNMLKDVFEEYGFEVIQAFDAAECKSAFLQYHPDLAFIDVQMPKSGGMDALNFIKQRSARTIVVMMTGVGNEKIAVQAMKLGASDYITKPFGTHDVVKLAQKLLDNRKAGEETSRLINKVRSSEKYLAHLTTIINEALITTDSHGRIQFVNRAALNMWGYSHDELHNEDIHLLISGEAGGGLQRDLVKDTINIGKIEGEFFFRRKDKTTFPGYLSTSVISDGSRVSGIVFLIADMTQSYEIERRLKQSEKLASLGQVVEGIAHEVRNSLTSLGGFTMRLRKATAEDPVCSQYTRIMLEDVARLEKMVRDIEEYVNFAKFHRFKFTRVNVLVLIEKARDRVKSEISSDKKQNIRFIIKNEPNIPTITADEKAIEEVFYQLTRNAFESIVEAGKVTLTVRHSGPSVSISFADTGLGFAMEVTDELFDPFCTTKTTGAGMGLSKVYLLVEEHGGLVNIHSEQGKGTTCEVLLPVERLGARAGGAKGFRYK